MAEILIRHVAESAPSARTETVWMKTVSATKLQRARPQFRAAVRNGWDAALLEIEHQAEHWDTPDHGETGRLIAAALRSAADIARAGGLRCEHRSHCT